MLFILGVFISVILAFVLLYNLFISTSPERILDLGFINYLIDNPGPALGGLIGMMAVSFFVILPILTAIPTNIHAMMNQRKFRAQPIKVTGRILTVSMGESYTDIDISYAEYKNSFHIDNRVLSMPIKSGANVTVYYDPKNKKNAYLDFFDAIEQEKSKIVESNTLFKLLEISPRFDLNQKSFELVGELHGGELNGKKASIVYELSRDEISQYSPGTLFPCVIHGTQDNYSISILANG